MRLTTTKKKVWQMHEYTRARKYGEIADIESGMEGRSQKQLEPEEQKVKGKLRHTTQLLCIALPMQSICKCSLTGQFTLAYSQCSRLTYCS